MVPSKRLVLHTRMQDRNVYTVQVLRGGQLVTLFVHQLHNGAGIVYSPRNVNKDGNVVGRVPQGFPSFADMVTRFVEAGVLDTPHTE